MNRFPATLPALLAELVDVPSVNPDGDPGGSETGEARLAEVVAARLRSLGADVESRDLAPGRPNVIGVFEPARPARATVVLAPHLDTVGVAGMTVPPFALTRRAGRLHGRGACDTKGPMAALFWALWRWTRGGSRRGGADVRWIVAATAGEEEGSAGAHALVKAGFRADFAVALEPTALRVVHAAKGFLRLWIETEGRAHHGAQPERGDNAIYRMLPLALALRDTLAPELAARRHPVLGGASLNLGVMQGGRDLNIVPDRCRVGLDIRLHPGVPAAEVLGRVQELIRAQAPRATLSVYREGPSFVTARTQPWARALRRAGRGWATADWFCDANIFAGAGVPAVAFGPGDIAQAHTKDEYIRARALAAGATAFGRFLAGM